jgi:hypothetical protein
LLTSELSEIYVQEAGTPIPTEIPVMRNPARSIGKFTESITTRTPSI